MAFVRALLCVIGLGWAACGPEAARVELVINLVTDLTSEPDAMEISVTVRSAGSSERPRKWEGFGDKYGYWEARSVAVFSGLPPNAQRTVTVRVRSASGETLERTKTFAHQMQKAVTMVVTRNCSGALCSECSESDACAHGQTCRYGVCFSDTDALDAGFFSDAGLMEGGYFDASLPDAALPDGALPEAPVVDGGSMENDGTAATCSPVVAHDDCAECGGLDTPQKRCRRWSYGKHQYALCLVSKPFVDARRTCMSLPGDGDLAVINDEKEDKCVQDQIRKSYAAETGPISNDKQTYIGLTSSVRAGDTDTFAWLDGTPRWDKGGR